jgi:hypothetical protein
VARDDGGGLFHVLRVQFGASLWHGESDSCISSLVEHRGRGPAQITIGGGRALALAQTKIMILGAIVSYEDRWRPSMRYNVPTRVIHRKYESTWSISGSSNPSLSKICELTRNPWSLGGGYCNMSPEGIQKRGRCKSAAPASACG